MNFMEYISSSMSKGTIGAYASVGVFALFAVCVLLGTFFGAKRGFSKSVIRIFTVGASAVCSFLGVKWICKMIVDGAEKISADGTKSLADILNSYPSLTSSIPEVLNPILEEIDAGTATTFAMMIVAIVVSPLLFISIFQILKAASFFLYGLLAGLTGAISYGKGPVSTVLGAVVGCVQGAIIAAVMIFPISGLCNVAMEAREPLMGNTDAPNAYIANAYSNVIDDLETNPLFSAVDKLGGRELYEDMITIKIKGEKMYMGDKCIGAVRVVADLMPVARPGFNWKHPSDTDRAAFSNTVKDIGGDELVAELTADLLRGAAKSIKADKINTGLAGATDALVDDVMDMFSTTTAQTVEGDLDIVLDVYFVMCDRNVLDSFNDGVHNDMRALLTTRGEDGRTTASVIIDVLNQYERATPIVTSFTKISLSVMHGSESFGEEADQLYENVKEGVTDALTHKKSDYATEEEYKEAVQSDLDKALAENNINVSESVRENMVDYIANNYGDHEGEITEREVNDALLSYYESYANATQNSGTNPDPDTDPGTEGEYS